MTEHEGGDGVFRLIYRSRDRIAPEQRKTELGALFSTARSNNKRLGLGGALLLSDEFFVQTLEGDEQVVRDLFARIEKDPRHDSVKVIRADEVAERAFPRWAMAQVSEAGPQSDTYLIAHADGIAPASSRGSTPAQEAVLGAMRDAMYGGVTRL